MTDEVRRGLVIAAAIKLTNGVHEAYQRTLQFLAYVMAESRDFMENRGRA
jgi:hypothetical protein